MELRKPRSKTRHVSETQPAFPIFIESEVGLSIENWVPVVCVGTYDGLSVIVSSPAEMNALFTMGNFGKGSNSRSKPITIRNRPELPAFVRERQYKERKKWTEKSVSDETSGSEGDTSAIDELHSLFSQMLEQKIIQTNSDNIGTESTKSLQQSFEPSRSYGAKNIQHETKVKDCADANLEHANFTPNSVVVVPDSDSEEENYFKDLNPKLCIDKSGMCESLVLSLEEAFFLAYGLGCLQILSMNKIPMSIEESWKTFCDSQHNFPIKYCVYHYFRSKGWIVKPGIKFGGDFLLYKRGQSFYHASYIVLSRLIDESSQHEHNIKHDWLSLQNYIRLSATAAKEILFAHVILPKNTTVDDIIADLNKIGRVSVCEILMRRWIPSQNRKHEYC